MDAFSKLVSRKLNGYTTKPDYSDPSERELKKALNKSVAKSVADDNSETDDSV